MATVIIAQAPAINKQAVIACCYSGRPKTTLDGCKAASWSARKKSRRPISQRPRPPPQECGI